MRDQTIVTAYHEAGHAVMAMSCGFPVSLISIEPNADSRGRVMWHQPIELDVLSLRKAVLTSMAGIAADFEHWNISEAEMEMLAGHYADCRMGNEFQSRIGKKECLDLYIGFAIRFLREPTRWSLVEYIVSLLLQGGQIDGVKLLGRWYDGCPKISDAELEDMATLLALDQKVNWIEPKEIPPTNTASSTT